MHLQNLKPQTQTWNPKNHLKWEAVGNKEHKNTCKIHTGFTSQIPLLGAFHPLWLQEVHLVPLQFYKDTGSSAVSKNNSISVQVVKK